MSTMHQHALDRLRAVQHAEPAPPLPGAHDLAELRTARTFFRRLRSRLGRP
ncbi:hypothetical protein [Kitasatospora sp. CB01950]|uniref:hypothetical protein n=1 Tax=Kitasatospora sp. CB01950 TaxID=1703930 RepID=UPI00130115D2|nr:hypothetical protein [Kitasatospora sp. CB01950]